MPSGRFMPAGLLPVDHVVDIQQVYFCSDRTLFRRVLVTTVYLCTQ